MNSGVGCLFQKVLVVFGAPLCVFMSTWGMREKGGADFFYINGMFEHCFYCALSYELFETSLFL
jgi:hypothetical protein